jgi:regulatory protein YycH of two-component signal transduction system YycFG
MDLFSQFSSVISYNNNTEYRNWIRRIFHFTKDAKVYYANLTEKDMSNEIDEESRDEMDFDYNSMQTGLDIIFEQTIDESIFEELYQFAAASMISTDVKIGQAILCSYDHFYLYYTCLWHFFMNKPQKIESLKEYQELLFRLRK